MNAATMSKPIFLLLAVAIVTWTPTLSAELQNNRPNIMIVLVDDLGFSDLGCYGGEIETPNIDQLAANGLRYTQFYNTGRCWPTRASILTGYYAQQVRRDKLPNIPSGGGGKRPSWAPLLPQILKPLGYRSYHSGKWHVDSMPVACGFDDSYYVGDQGRFFSPQRMWVNDVKQPAVERDTGYYATTAIAEHAVSILAKHHEQHADQPFFHYIAFTAPHFPLHALPEDFAKYSDKYDDGWQKHRQQRWERIRKTGIVTTKLSPVERDQGAPYVHPDQVAEFGPGEVDKPLPWDELTDEQKQLQTIKMALHAAMVDRIDREMGRIVEQLKSSGAFDNTLILFLSDNGASAELMVRDDGHDPRAEPGSADTHFCLGPGWSTVSNTPFRKHKTWVHEGGIATPLVVSWPAGIESKGQLRLQPAHVIDFVPTILEAASGRFQKVREDQPDLPGVSLLTTFANRDQKLDRDYLWWAHDGHEAIRVGQLKLVRTKNSDWELYDLGADRAETINIAGVVPEVADKLAKQWKSVQDEFIKHALLEPPE